MSCIGTAGHVDHGKSTLVTALTGMDPDRLAEEKARGMTIDLGFAWLTLPSGREASVVDVPGHEHFIKNMLAGVGGIEVALLVVAADEGIMPQTREHLAILDLLRVRTGVVALTKADLVDAEWLDLVREEVAQVLSETTLAGAPIVPCSAVTGQGLPDLLTALDAALDAAPAARDLGQPRLPIDRVFSITGFGTVVTGTLLDGPLAVGQELVVLPAGIRTRARGLQAHKSSIERGRPGGRLAVNLAGISRAEARRGDVLCLPGQYRATTALDVRLDVLASAPRPLTSGAQLELYLGAAEVPARVLLLDADELRPGQQGWAQLRLRAPLVAARGDRFILRVPSPSATICGGMVAEPVARRHRRRDAAVLARLEVLARGDPAHLLLAALHGARSQGTPIGCDLATLADRSGLPLDQVREAVQPLVAEGTVLAAGPYHYARDVWEQVTRSSTEALAAYHRQYPLRTGMPREEWRARVRLAPREATDALALLAAQGQIAEAGAAVRLPGHAPRFTPAQEQAVAALLARYDAEPFAPPTREEAEAAVGADVLAALLERGDLIKMSDAILLARAAYAEVLTRLLGHLRSHETLTVAEARDLLGTTRKYMLAIFEHLDERRITLRRGESRILGPGAAQHVGATEHTPQR